MMGLEEDKTREVNELIVRHIALANKLAIRYAPPHLMEEAAAEGRMALVRAAKNYQQNLGRFSAYAAKVIKNRIIDYVKSEELPGISINSYVGTKLRKVREAINNSRSGRESAPPSFSEIAELTGISARKLGLYIELATIETIWIDAKSDPSGEKDLGSRHDAIPGPTKTPRECYETASMHKAICEQIKELDPRSRTIIERIYGLDGREPQTPVQLAEMFGLTAERVRQLHRAAIETIRIRVLQMDAGGCAA